MDNTLTEIEPITGKLIHEFNEKIDLFIKAKLTVLEREAFRIGEIELASILQRLDLGNVEKAKQELDKMGYILEIEQPLPEFFCGADALMATIEADKIKLKVKKVILEI